MSIRLNFWQTLLLFLPGVIGLAIINLPHRDLQGYQTLFAIANFLWVLDMFIVIGYQTYLALKFNTISGVKSQVFKWNVCVPLLFILGYLLFVIWVTFVNPADHNPRYNAGPLEKIQIHGSGLIFLFLFIHAFITFYFVNNQFVLSKVKLITGDTERETLKENFLIPMERLIKASLWMIGGVTLILFVADIIRAIIDQEL